MSFKLNPIGVHLCIIEGAAVKTSILSNNIKVLQNAQVENSIIMEDVVISEGAKIKNAIIDKEVVVPANCEIGYNIEEDKKRFVLTTSGIVIVPKRAKIKE
jgi:glucose-1-phosphate adenylyltransferase